MLACLPEAPRHPIDRSIVQSFNGGWPTRPRNDAAPAPTAPWASGSARQRRRPPRVERRIGRTRAAPHAAVTARDRQQSVSGVNDIDVQRARAAPQKSLASMYGWRSASGVHDVLIASIAHAKLREAAAQTPKTAGSKGRAQHHRHPRHRCSEGERSPSEVHDRSGSDVHEGSLKGRGSTAAHHHLHSWGARGASEVHDTGIQEEGNAVTMTAE